MAGGIRFLSVEDVLAIHEDTLLHEGGGGGLRDPGLLESAVLTPQQQFRGAYLHRDLGAMAAAYLFHLAQNHPFTDGNKRTAALAALVFLDVNGAGTLPDPDEMLTITMDLAAGHVDKQTLIRWMQNRLRPRRRKPQRR